MQEPAPNHLKLRELRVLVVSVDGKGGARLRQVWIKEANVSEPLTTCRNAITDVKTGFLSRLRDKIGGNLRAAQSASGM